MALTPTQMNTKTKVVEGHRTSDQLYRSSPFGRVRNAPNKLIALRLLPVGSMVMLHTGLHRIQNVDAMGYDVFLGPRGTLSAAAAAAATSLAVNNIESGITTIPAGTWVLVGGVQEKQNREMVKTSAAISVSATGTATITITTALVKPFTLGTRITIFHIPTGFDSPYRRVPDLEPYLQTNENSVVYQLYPSVPMQPKFIGRDGDITATGLVSDEATFNQLTTGGRTRFQHMGAALQGNNGAVGTVTFTGNPTTDQTIAIISTDGTTKTYTAKTSEAFGSNQFKADGGAAANATSLKGAIEHASGHAGKILVSRATGVLTLTQNFHPIGNQGNTTITENLANCTVVNFTGGEYLGLHDSAAAIADYDEDCDEVGSASRDIAGWISPKIFINQPYGVERHNVQEDTSAATARSPLSTAGFIDAHVSPENSPNPAFEMWLGVGETSLPSFRIKNDTGESLSDPRVRLTGYKYLMVPVPVEDVERMLRRAGRFKYEIIPRAENAQEKEQALSSPMNGWSSHVREYRGRRMSAADYVKAVQSPTQQVKNILQGTNIGSDSDLGNTQDPRRRHR